MNPRRPSGQLRKCNVAFAARVLFHRPPAPADATNHCSIERHRALAIRGRIEVDRPVSLTVGLWLAFAFFSFCGINEAIN
jgi:hypothetical protein